MYISLAFHYILMYQVAGTTASVVATHTYEIPQTWATSPRSDYSYFIGSI